MGKTIYIQCYEGLSAKMMVEALLNLMPEQTQAKGQDPPDAGPGKPAQAHQNGQRLPQAGICRPR